MIVKVQVPLASSIEHDPPPLLVYDRLRKHKDFLEQRPAIIEALGDDLKGYFNATWSPTEGFTIHDRVADQPW